MKTSAKSRERNRGFKTAMRSKVKEYRESSNKAPEQARLVASVLDKAASKKIIHKNKAARLKSRLAKMAAK
jgi:small subunit ribosomal protein S20